MISGQHSIVPQQIHGFSNASVRAYAAVAYLRTVYGNGHVRVCLMSSKTRVAPLKEQTIPGSELFGATILARLVSYICIMCGFNYDTYCVYCAVLVEEHSLSVLMVGDSVWAQSR